MFSFFQHFSNGFNCKVIIFIEYPGSENDGRNVSFTGCPETENYPGFIKTCLRLVGMFDN